MEKKLKILFDYQRFEKNERLEKIIKETESRYARELSDDDLVLVNAAGEINPGKIDGNNSAGSGGGIYQYGNSGGLDGKSGSPIGGGGGAGAGGNGTAMSN